MKTSKSNQPEQSTTVAPRSPSPPPNYAANSTTDDENEPFKVQ